MRSLKSLEDPGARALVRDRRRQHAGRLMAIFSNCGPSSKRLAHVIDLRIDVLVDGQSLQRGLQRRARVDEHPRIGFIPVGKREYD